MAEKAGSAVNGLVDLLDRIDEAVQGSERASLGMAFRAFGNRAFGPVLLFAGLVTLAPLVGDIPGVPTLMGIVVFLTAVQMMFNPGYFWLPDWLLKRSIGKEKVSKALDALRRPARFIDRLIGPRLTFMVGKAGSYAIAAACLLIACLMPPMEFVPFSANGAGAALTAFGLALVAQDGLLAMLAFAVTGAAAGLTLYGLL